MIIVGEVIKTKKFGSYCAIILNAGNNIVRALAYANVPVIEGDKIELKGHYRQRDGYSEFFSEVLNKC